MGTLAHEYMEVLVQQRFLKREVRLPEAPDAEILALCHKAMRMLDTCIAQFDDLPSKDHDISSEMKLGMPDLYWGWADLVIPYQNHVLVIDWKFGYLEPDPENAELQLAGYLEPAMETFDVSMGRGYMIAPRIDQVYHLELKRESRSVRGFAEILKNDCATEDAPLKSGDWCKYCRANGICSETQKDMAVVPNSEDDGLTQEGIAQALPLLKRVEEAVKNVKTRAKEILKEKPDAFPGWKLNERRGNRGITETGEAELRTRGILDREVMMGTMKFSVPSLEQEFRTALGDDFEGVWESTIKPLIVQPTHLELRKVKPPKEKTDGKG